MNSLLFHFKLFGLLIELICCCSTRHNDLLSFELSAVVKSYSTILMINVDNSVAESKICSELCALLFAALQSVLNSYNSGFNCKHSLNIVWDSECWPSLIDLSCRQ